MKKGPFLVAILEESIVGFVNVVDDEAEIFSIYLLPETQGKNFTISLCRKRKYEWHEL
ncbi:MULTISPECIES: GNAT family N-acetyltransferase [unclassified Lysinibacillus]|uniref:GNAT family N-acetyltransferase n=1 Tax=unclassified Lysinibacillus TaxID=2636778 RepID=UPI00201141FA|nr:MULTISPECIES: GNAT family N-acetyltransferase [unclassified Lysinibacillus]MCL1696191.1 GNAT family N-acetyltransferase [Lysinibacillus sp. BPa_S21]MCL1700434.1 GNAT family N-acetyltransferase [Lysinibacillus sp. Bpr_S20]